MLPDHTSKDSRPPSTGSASYTDGTPRGPVIETSGFTNKGAGPAPALAQALARLRWEADTEQGKSEQRFHEIVDNLPVAIYTTDEEGRLTHFNPAAVEFSGRVPELGSDRWCVTWKLYYPDGRPMLHDECPMALTLKEGRVVRGEAIAERPDGRRLWFEAYPSPLRDIEGKIVGGISMLVDVTERRRVEEALRESEERFRQVAEVAPQFIWVNRADGSTEYVNQRWVNYSGLDLAATADPEQLAAAIHRDDRTEIFSKWQRSVAMGEEFEMEARLRAANGEYRWFLVRTVPLLDESGRVVKWFGSSTDIADRKRAEDALRELNETLEARVAERTAALAQSEAQLRAMASRLTRAEQEERRRISQVLHDDLQQQLYGIQMKLSFVRQDFESGYVDAALESLSEVEEMLDHGVEITRRLTVDLSPPILNTEGLADMLRWLVSEMKEMHDLDVALVADHPFRIPDEDMRVLLFQIVRELLFNVVKHAGARHATVELQDDHDRLVISVADDGDGFDVSQVAARAAEEGGFGLFSARERLRLFGGRMQIESIPGQGARIRLDVPLSMA